MSAQSRIALGIFRRGSSVSSDSVETASKPRNDSASTAAPAKTAPVSMPEPANGDVQECTSTSPVIRPIASTANTAMKMNCAAMRTKFMLDSSRMPRMFRPVTSATATTIHSACGVLGK
jgi:hypothetical protein